MKRCCSQWRIQTPSSSRCLNDVCIVSVNGTKGLKFQCEVPTATATTIRVPTSHIPQFQHVIEQRFWLDEQQAKFRYLKWPVWSGVVLKKWGKKWTCVPLDQSCSQIKHLQAGTLDHQRFWNRPNLRVLRDFVGIPEFEARSALDLHLNIRWRGNWSTSCSCCLKTMVEPNNHLAETVDECSKQASQTQIVPAMIQR